MGFWKAVGKVASNVVVSVVEEQKRNVEKIERTQRSASSYDDRKVVEKFQNTSGLDKVAYARELEARGYLEKNANGKYERTNKKL